MFSLWFLQPGLTLTDVLMRVLSVLVIIFLVLPVHEFSHAWMAYKLGDTTAKNRGRLTLNPLPSIDPLGALCILLFGFGWARPVPVKTGLLSKHPKRDMALTALAGPVSNVVAALVGAIIYNIIYLFHASIPTGVLSAFYLFFQYYISINVSIAVFNLLPIPPLDGSKILASFLPDRIAYKIYQSQGIITIVIFLLLFTGVLSYPISWLSSWVYRGVVGLAALPFSWF